MEIYGRPGVITWDLLTENCVPGAWVGLKDRSWTTNLVDSSDNVLIGASISPIPAVLPSPVDLFCAFTTHLPESFFGRDSEGTRASILSGQMLCLACFGEW